MKEITRFELITENGREVIIYSKDGFHYSLQDEGKTLKVFTRGYEFDVKGVKE